MFLALFFCTRTMTLFYPLYARTILGYVTPWDDDSIAICLRARKTQCPLCSLNLLIFSFKRIAIEFVYTTWICFYLSTGTGLGLSIIKKALERNRGHIEVNSVQGEGTTFQAFIRPVRT